MVLHRYQTTDFSSRLEVERQVEGELKHKLLSASLPIYKLIDISCLSACASTVSRVPVTVDTQCHVSVVTLINAARTAKR